MKDAYAAYIASVDNPRGRCQEITLEMQAEFPELVRVRGHYLCPLYGRRPHWWLTDEAGMIIDPTASQFVPGGDYVEWTGDEPTGRCINCGENVFDHSLVCGPGCGIAAEARCQ
jgi:hypothetical protein